MPIGREERHVERFFAYAGSTEEGRTMSDGFQRVLEHIRSIAENGKQRKAAYSSG